MAYNLRLVTTEKNINVKNNTSGLLVEVYCDKTSGTGAWSLSSTTCNVTCDNVTNNITLASYDFRGQNSIKIGECIFNIKHNENGSKTAYLSVIWSSNNSSIGQLRIEQQKTLTKINRWAVINSVNNFTDEEDITIAYTNYLGDNAQELQACISLDGSKDDISYRNISKNATKHVIVLTNAEKEVLYNATSAVNSIKVKVFIRTKIDGVWFMESKQVTFSVVNANPIVGDIVYGDSNLTVQSIIKDSQKILRSRSELNLRIYNPTLLKGAKFKKYDIEFLGDVRTSTSDDAFFKVGTIDSSENFDIKVTIYDTRGNYSTKIKKVTMIDYEKPQLIAKIQRLNNYEDTTYLQVNATIHEVDGKNKITSLKYKYKELNKDFGALQSINNNEKITLTLDKEKEFIFEIIVIDIFGGTNAIQVKLNKGVFPIFIDTAKNSVGINKLPIYSQSLEVAGQAYFDNMIQTTSADFIKNTNKGMFKLPNGLLIQFGTHQIKATSKGTTINEITFAYNFTTCFGVFTSDIDASAVNDVWFMGKVGTTAISNSGFKIVYKNNGTATGTYNVRWCAIGW